MTTIKASEFKARCLQLMDEVSTTGDSIVITKNGHPVARLVPYKTKRSSLWSIYEGRIHMQDDLIEPVEVEWESNIG